MAESILLKGCTPVPLANYLKALAILRLVSEQRDANALGYWQGEHFVLESKLNEAGLLEFLLQEYRPTPIVAPWNGGSGFFPKDQQAGISAIEESNSGRLEEYRRVISYFRKLLQDLGIEKSPKNEEKKQLLTRIRSEGHEAVLAWVDAAVLLTEEAMRFPPLLGTGGNDGRLDFTNNFMQRITEIIALDDGDEATEDSRAWLSSAIFDISTPDAGVKGPIGQFNPGRVGGPNATTGFEGASLVNPWDYVLMMEGSLLFAAAASRRLEKTGYAALSYPFTVRPTVAGVGNASKEEEKKSRAELWLPIWNNPTSYSEVHALFREGRATVNRRPVEDGLDFVRALASLGVDRGFSSFQRYSFLERSGKAYLATPFGRVVVKRNPDADLISDLERLGFLQRLRGFARSDDAPGRLKLLTKRLEDGLFSLAQRFAREQLAEILITLGEIQQTVGISGKAREKVRPVPRLSEEWVTKAYDGTPEFRLACALAGLWNKEPEMPMRMHLAPVNTYGDRWLEESELFVWDEGRLVKNIGRVVHRRYLEIEKSESGDKPYWFVHGARVGDVADFLGQDIQESRIDSLLRGLVLCKIPRVLDAQEGEGSEASAAIVSFYSILKPFFVPDELLKKTGFLPEDSRLPLAGDIPALLTSGQIERAVEIAWTRLRSVGVALPDSPLVPPIVLEQDGERLLAGLVFPIDFGELRKVLDRLMVISGKV